jgi:hypothetical protein
MVSQEHQGSSQNQIKEDEMSWAGKIENAFKI